jgi:hypothetical protein
MTYTVTGGNGCIRTVTRTVTVTAPPSAGNLTGGQTICVGSNTTFSSTVSPGTWTSSAPAVASINPNSGLINGVTAGTATMTYTVMGSGGCSNATAQRDVTVIPLPQVPVVSTLGIDTMCHGQVATLRLANPYPAGATYTWSTPGGTVAQIEGANNEADCTIRWRNAPPVGGPTGATVAGSYTVSVAFGGCSVSFTGSLRVSNYYASCPKGIVFFEPSGLGVLDPEAQHFQWGTLDANGAQFTPLAGETDQTLFQSQLASLTGGLGATPPFTVRSSIYPDKCFSCTSVWVDQDGLDRPCLAPAAGMITEPGHVVYPNPADGKSLTIEATGGQLEEALICELYDVHGRLVHTERLFVQPIARLAQDLSGLDRGMYLLRLRSGRSEENVKLILE